MDSMNEYQQEVDYIFFFMQPYFQIQKKTLIFF